MVIVFVPVTPFGAVAVTVAVPRTCGSITRRATAEPFSVVTVLLTEPRVVTRPTVVPSATGWPPETVTLRVRSMKLPQVPAFGKAAKVIVLAGVGATGAGRKPRLGQRALKAQFARQVVPKPQIEPPKFKPGAMNGLLQKTRFRLQPTPRQELKKVPQPPKQALPRT